MKLKGIIEYILRVIIFLILTAFLHDKISEKLIEILEHIATIFLFIVCIGVTYYFAKITGIFKKLDSIKKWQSFLILFSISIISNIIGIVLDKFKLFNFDIRTNIEFCGFFLIPSYLCYLYFKHLTKKHPVPFKKIGYYFSIEFYKNIFNKLMSGVKSMG